MTEPHQDAAGDWVCEHGTAMDVHCCNCHSGFQFNQDACRCTSDKGRGALPTDAIWKLLNEADDKKSSWSSGAWCQWFVRLVDAVSQLESAATVLAEYNSGSEDCAFCKKATQNGVWCCDLCLDEVKILAAEFLLLRHATQSQ